MNMFYQFIQLSFPVYWFVLVFPPEQIARWIFLAVAPKVELMKKRESSFKKQETGLQIQIASKATFHESLSTSSYLCLAGLL